MSLFEPLDEHNQTLRANVAPEDWTNPSPDGKYNLVVLGGGPAGLICAAGAAGLGAKVALMPFVLFEPEGAQTANHANAPRVKPDAETVHRGPRAVAKTASAGTPLNSIGAAVAAA